MTHEEKMLALCANIRHLRKKHGLSKAAMAKILGIGVRMLNLLEHDVVSLRLGSEMLVNASDYFNVTTESLFVPPES